MHFKGPRPLPPSSPCFWLFIPEGAKPPVEATRLPKPKPESREDGVCKWVRNLGSQEDAVMEIYSSGSQ